VNIEDVEGIGPDHAASLQGIGIATTEALLERGATSAGRDEIAASAGVSGKLVLEWVNHVDLMRIDGVGSEYSDLLEAAGVDSPAELAQRNAANLAQTFQELDAARPDWIRSLPSEATVEKWIAQAKTLPKIVTHGGGSGAAGEPQESGAATEAAAMAEVPAPTAEVAEPMAEVAEPATAAPLAFAAPMEPVQPAAPAPPPAAPAPPPSAPAPAPARDEAEGIWARIKRFFGG
jgi:predicted flap endonuclease-1-like 5' DNA nuclease